MIKVIIINKTGNIKTCNIKDNENYEDDLYKKAGLKNKDEFKKFHSWKCKQGNKDYVIDIYGKDKGRSGNENKFEFPPPIENVLFYGSCIILKKENNKLVNLDEDEWNKSYQKFYGDFEDLNKTYEEDENEEDELINIASDMKTKTGYLKDNFVVDEDDNIEYYSSNSDDDCINSNEPSENDNDDNESDNNESDNIMEDDVSELTEEPYIFSDDEN